MRCNDCLEDFSEYHFSARNVAPWGLSPQNETPLQKDVSLAVTSNRLVSSTGLNQELHSSHQATIRTFLSTKWMLFPRLSRRTTRCRIGIRQPEPLSRFFWFSPPIRSRNLRIFYLSRRQPFSCCELPTLDIPLRKHHKLVKIKLLHQSLFLQRPHRPFDPLFAPPFRQIRLLVRRQVWPCS